MFKEMKITFIYFYSIVRKEKPKYSVFLVLSILLNGSLPFINLILPKFLIDELVGHKRINIILSIVITIIVGNMLFRVLLHIVNAQLEKLDDWFDRFFFTELSKRTMYMDFQHTENPEALDQRRKAMDGMGWYSGGLRGLSQCFKQILSYSLTLLGVVAIIATASPILLIITILSVIGSSIIVRQINRVEIAMFEKGPKINRAFHYAAYVLTRPEYSRSVRMYEADQMLLKNAGDTMEEIYKIFLDTSKGTAKWSNVNSVINFGKNIGVYLYLGYRLIRGFMGIGDFTMLATSANTLKDSLQGITTQVQELQKKLNFMCEFKKFMEYKDGLEHNDAKIVINEAPTIEFCHVSFHYPMSEEYVLKDVNITIHPGEHLAVVGLNGAGKTTFIKLLCRLYDVNEGEILVNRVNIKEYDYDEYMKLMSVVFQDFHLFALTIEENIRFGDWDRENVDMDNLCHVCGLKEKVDSFEKGFRTQIYKYFDKSGVELSGGESQKMAIARALYKEAPIVILDEPTAALDPVAEYDIYKHFDNLVGGKTAVYISHRLSSCKFCDRIAVFAENTIKEYGTHNDLVRVKDGIYANMFATQAKYYV